MRRMVCGKWASFNFSAAVWFLLRLARKESSSLLYIQQVMVKKAKRCPADCTNSTVRPGTSLPTPPVYWASLSILGSSLSQVTGAGFPAVGSIVVSKIHPYTLVLFEFLPIVRSSWYVKCDLWTGAGATIELNSSFKLYVYQSYVNFPHISKGIESNKYVWITNTWYSTAGLIELSCFQLQCTESVKCSWVP